MFCESCHCLYCQYLAALKLPRTEATMSELTLEEATHRLAPIYTSEEAAIWWLSGQKVLDGNIPAELVADGKSAEVRAGIEAVVSGAYI